MLEEYGIVSINKVVDTFPNKKSVLETFHTLLRSANAFMRSS